MDAVADKLLWGVKNGDLDTVKQCVEKNGFNVNLELSNGRDAIHYAADYGQSEVLRYLLSKGANVNAPDKHGITAMLAAFWESHVECVKVLVSKGAAKIGNSPDGKTYLECAESEEIKTLLK
uniref:Myotrophin n=1 Tax=Lubomirskia baikalensis TaxID=289074 RepID=A4F3R5_9METZ|nr:myotrophin [Lubomirskia baikalensis]